MKRRWPYILLALAVASVILTFPRVSCAQGCAPISAILEKAEADSRLVEIRVLQGEQLKYAIEAFNAEASADIAFTTGYFAIRSDGAGMLLLGFDDGIICAYTKYKPHATWLFLRHIDGSSI